MRLIDADALLERRKSVYIEYIDDEDFDENCDDAFVVLAKHVINSPTIEAEPVKHGRWEHDSVGFDDFWRCSACKEDWFFEYDPENESTRVNYCPNCGAKMDLEGNDAANRS